MPSTSVQHAEEYLVPSPRAMNQPAWVFVTSVAVDCPYKALPMKLMPPAAVTGNLPHSSMYFLIDGEPEDLLSYNLKRGVNLTVAEIRSCLSSRGIPVPPKGSGKKNRVLKSDLLFALLKGVFPDLDESKIREMMHGTMRKKQDDDEENPELLLNLVAGLDTKEAEHFSKVRHSAATELERRHEAKEQSRRKQGKLPDAEEPGTQPPEPSEAKPARKAADAAKGPAAAHLKIRAPDELRDMLPPGITNCYINVRLQQRVCTAEFKRPRAK